MKERIRKKVIYISSARVPTENAHGVQIMKTCEALANLGIPVTLFVSNRKSAISDDPFKYYNVRSNFELKYLRTLNIVGTIPRIGSWLNSFVLSFSALIEMRREKDFIIYSREKVLLYVFSFFYKDRLYWEPHVGTWDLIVRRVLKCVEGIISISEGGKSYFLNKGVSRDDIIVAPDAVDIDEFETDISKEDARARLQLPSKDKIVMYVGLFDEWKGYRVLLNASRSLERGVVVVMIGGTLKQVSQLKKDYPNVIFVGYRPYRELPINQKAADILVIPNSAKSEVSAHFTSPLKLFSYMASGRPIVASDIPSIREIVSQVSALFVQPDAPSALADGITKLLRDDSLASRIASQARKDVENYTWDRRAKKILSFITV